MTGVPAWLSRSSLEVGLLALALYGIFYVLRPAGDELIEVTPVMVEELAQRREALVGRILTETERNAVVDAFLEEEILVREAVRRGLDRGDAQIRSMLTGDQRAELLRSSGFEPPAPSEVELREYYEVHEQRYQVPERVDLEQILYSASSTPLALEEIVKMVASGVEISTLGDVGASGSASGVSRADVSQVYGLELANEIFTLDVGQWRGPFVSPAGTHFVRINGRTPRRERNFEEVQPYVIQDYHLDAETRALADALAPLARRYHVSIEDEQIRSQ